MVKRGDVVVADFPFQDAPGSKVRPALVVQNDADNQSLDNTILAMITGNLRGADRKTNVAVDPITEQGRNCGLHGQSLVKCGNLATVNQRRVFKVIGHLSATLMAEVDDGLKAALDLP
jgi:mRNA interferase MazF